MSSAVEPHTQSNRTTAVVIVNYRTPVLTADAVRSVISEPAVGEIIVVENGSGDGSYELLRKHLDHPQVRLIRSMTNLGFGPGVNLGVTYCQAPLLLFLNSDAMIVAGSVDRLADTLLNDEGIGVLAPAVYRADGTLQRDSYGMLPATQGPLFRKRTPPGQRSILDRQPGWVSGVAMFMRRSDFLALGGFDASFMMYLEDVDLCRRIRQTGKTIAREPTAAVVHFGTKSQSSRITPVKQFHASKAIYLERVGASPSQQRYARWVGAVRILEARLRSRIRS